MAYHGPWGGHFSDADLLLMLIFGEKHGFSRYHKMRWYRVEREFKTTRVVMKHTNKLMVEIRV